MIDAPQELDILAIGQAFLSSSPKWIDRLLRLRNKLVKVFGLKAGERYDETTPSLFKGIVGEKIGLFKVYAMTESEIILGEDDKHLNFRVSLFLDETETKKNLTISTTVVFNNVFGRLYFFWVKPFHKRIVPVMLKGVIREIEKG